VILLRVPTRPRGRKRTRPGHLPGCWGYLRLTVERAAAELPGRPVGALLFTCNGRGRRMFGVADHDASTIEDLLGGIPLAGFFAGGEVGPIAGPQRIARIYRVDGAVHRVSRYLALPCRRVRCVDHSSHRVAIHYAKCPPWSDFSATKRGAEITQTPRAEHSHAAATSYYKYVVRWLACPRCRCVS
jgi:hypothetical protein